MMEMALGNCTRPPKAHIAPAPDAPQRYSGVRNAIDVMVVKMTTISIPHYQDQPNSGFQVLSANPLQKALLVARQARRWWPPHLALAESQLDTRPASHLRNQMLPSPQKTLRKEFCSTMALYDSLLILI